MRVAFRFFLYVILSCWVFPATPNDLPEKPRHVRFAMTWDADSSLSESSVLFQNLVKTNLGDVLTLDKIPPEGTNTIRKALSDASIDIAVLSASAFPESVGAYVAGSDTEGSRRRQESEVGAYELTKLEKDGLVGLAFWNVVSRQILARGQINSLAGLKGMKVLAFENSSRDILKGVGASPITLSAAEVYTALQRGVADAAEVPLGSKFVEAAPKGEFRSALTDLTGAREYVVVTTDKFWASLPYRAQVELAKAARQAARRSDQVARAETHRGFQVLSAKGISVARFSARDIESVRKVSLAAWTRRDQNAEVLSRAYTVTSTKEEPTAGAAVQKAESREVFFATVRAFEDEKNIEYQFGNRIRDKGVNYGLARVSLKAGRRLGDDLEKVAEVERLERFASEDGFVSSIKAAPGFGGEQGILIFVHGYNNSFVEALRRAAQFAADGGFPGPIIAFSWPSDGSVLRYFHDEDRLPTTRFGFHDFMNAIEKLLPREKINLLAHSMGTRVVLNYTGTLKQIPSGVAKGRYRSLTLAASDGQIEFLRAQEDFLPDIASLITIYFSEHDRALWVSSRIHHAVRLGNISADKLFSDPETAPLADAGFDFVNAARIDKAFLTFSPRHGYVFDKPHGLADLSALVIEGVDAKDRSAQKPGLIVVRQNAGRKYWELNP